MQPPVSRFDWCPATISLSPRSSLHPLEPIGSHFETSSARHPPTTTPHFSHPFAVGGSAQLLHLQTQTQSQPPNPNPAAARTTRDPNSGSLTSSSTSSTHPDLDLDLFPIETNPSRQSAHSDPSSVGSPLNNLSASPRTRPAKLSSLPQSRSLSSSQHPSDQAQAQAQAQPNLKLDRFTSPTSASPPPPLQANHNLPSATTNVVNPALTRPTTKPNPNNTNSPSPFEPIPSSLPRSTTTLWMGDLESWMDEEYVRRCVVMMGWHLPHHPHPHPPNVKIKMVSGASPSSAYCFLTYPTAELAQEAWKMISNMPPTLMPGCERTFKLNWATGLPGVQPTWDREFSVFIRDLDREVSEGELVSLFTHFFPSTKSAKIMGDLSTGLSRGYAFIRFGEEEDLHKAIALGRSKAGTGMYLRGRSIKISEASGSSGTAGDHHPHHHRVSLPTQSSQVVPGANNKPGGERPRHASLNVAESHGGGNALEGRLEPQPVHRASLPTDLVDGPASREPHQSSGVSNLQHQPNSIIYPLARPSLGSSLPISAPSTGGVIRQPGVAGPGGLVQTMPNFRPTPAPFQILPYQRPPVCIPPSTPNGLVYATTTGPTRPTLASVPPPSVTPLPHPQAVYPAAIKHMRNPIATPCYLPESFHPPSPAPFQIHPGVVSMANFYATATPAAPPTAAGYFSATPAVVNGNAAHFAALAQIAVAANHANNDPSNTTVFVGGLPACISEETLKTFFQNFGEITYVKIPPNKGCGFVQYVRRSDAEAAMLKMHDFPIHGKSRIRLSWGRSLGDKQVEYVRKLSTALGIPFEAVWKIVEGQDHSTIKQIASAVGGQSSHPQTIPSATVSPTGFHPTNPAAITVTPGGGMIHPAYGSLDHLVDPLGFTIQQQHARLVAGTPDASRFPIEPRHQAFTSSLDSHRYILEASRFAALDQVRFASDPQVIQQEPIRYASSAGLGRSDSNNHNQVVVDSFPFAGAEQIAQDSRRLRSASEQFVAAELRNDSASRPNARLSFSSNDFYPRPSSYTLSQQQTVYSSSQRQSDSDETVRAHANDEASFRRPSPPTSHSFSGVLGDRNRSFGFSDDLLGSYTSTATVGGSREQNGDGFVLRNELGSTANGLRVSSLVNRKVNGDRLVDSVNGFPQQIQPRHSTIPTSSWTSNSTTGSTPLQPIEERAFFSKRIVNGASPPPYTTFSMDHHHQEKQQRRMFYEDSRKREEEERRRREEDDQQEEWNQLEADFKMRMKVEEQDSQAHAAMGEIVDGWPDLFGGRRVQQLQQLDGNGAGRRSSSGVLLSGLGK